MKTYVGDAELLVVLVISLSWEELHDAPALVSNTLHRLLLRRHCRCSGTVLQHPDSPWRSSVPLFHMLYDQCCTPMPPPHPPNSSPVDAFLASHARFGGFDSACIYYRPCTSTPTPNDRHEAPASLTVTAISYDVDLQTMMIGEDIGFTERGDSVSAGQRQTQACLVPLRCLTSISVLTIM